MSEGVIRVDGKLFLGRYQEQKQFRTALEETLAHTPRESLPYVILLHGDGGMGKTTLAKRFRDIVQTEESFADRFQTLWID